MSWSDRAYETALDGRGVDIDSFSWVATSAFQEGARWQREQIGLDDDNTSFTLKHESELPEESGVVFKAKNRETGKCYDFVTMNDGSIYSGQAIFKTYTREEFEESYEVI